MAAHTTINYVLVQHRGAARIAVRFPFNKQWNGRMQKVPGARWSSSLNAWHIPDTTSNRQVCGLTAAGVVSAIALNISGPTVTTSTASPAAAIKSTAVLPQRTPPVISAANQLQLQLFLQTLLLKAYSPATIRTYKNELAQLLQAIGNFKATNLCTDDIKRYLLLCIKQGLKENTIHSRLNAIKFYYEQVLKKERFLFDLPRPKKPVILPKLLNEQELQRLFNALTNRKHKAMLFTAYSAGLRVSELAKLKLADIDSSRMQVFIERAKGKKDRYVNLSPVLLDILRKYYHLYSPKPKVFLFESEQTFTAYPQRTIQQIFMNAKEKAGINKAIGIHSLRHSFATHLLDKGTDIKYIKDLLGHFNIKTTERYLHVSKQKLVNIISPFDDLWEKGSIEW